MCLQLISRRVYDVTECDLPRLPTEHSAERWLREVCGEWDAEALLAARQHRSPSLWRVSWAVRKSAIIKSGILCGITVGLNFAVLAALTAVIGFLNGEGTSFTTAVISAALLFVSTICRRILTRLTFCSLVHRSAQLRRRCCVTCPLVTWSPSRWMYILIDCIPSYSASRRLLCPQLQSGTLGLLYSKVVRVTCNISKGAVMTLVSTDTNRIRELAHNFHNVWAAPLTVFIAIGGLCCSG